MTAVLSTVLLDMVGSLNFTSQTEVTSLPAFHSSAGACRPRALACFKLSPKVSHQFLAAVIAKFCVVNPVFEPQRRDGPRADQKMAVRGVRRPDAAGSMEYHKACKLTFTG